MDSKFGMVRMTTACPRVRVGDPKANLQEHVRILKENQDSDIVLFPELSITGYTCGDLFHQEALRQAAIDAVLELTDHVENQLVVVGAPIVVGSALYNCAVVLNDNQIMGVVPKEFLPTYGEFYEGRWFAPARNPLPKKITPHWHYEIDFGIDLLFEFGQAMVAIEICEAIFMPIPPSSFYCIGGANIILNPSASPENVGKADYRQNLVIGQSGRGICGYGYASAGPNESTSDLVFGGHLMVAEGGHMLKESDRVGKRTDPVIKTPNRESYWITTDIDVQKLQRERTVTTSFTESKKYLDREFRTIQLSGMKAGTRSPLRFIDAHPFVPSNPQTLHARCEEIFGIQTCGLAKRLEMLGFPERPVPLSIGISGGLDSTLALLVACQTLDMMGVPRNVIRARTMPGFGTTKRTHSNSDKLMELTGVDAGTLDIRQLCFLEMQQIGHKPFGIDLDQIMISESFAFARKIEGQGNESGVFDRLLSEIPEGAEDLVFENVQARRRTEFLMNLGFVLGTGDMSELFLGWCTYNGDHQSMYNVNCGIPKTLVKFLVDYIAEHRIGGHPGQMDNPNNQLSHLLKDIVATEISPELLPVGKDGEIKQSTQDKIGPYELHDFTMFHMIRNGFAPDKILWMMKHAEGWDKEYSDEEREKWMSLALKRFFSQQYKRNDVPDGPKVGSVALSPRGDWRMPSDAHPATWLDYLERIEWTPQ